MRKVRTPSRIRRDGVPERGWRGGRDVAAAEGRGEIGARGRFGSSSVPSTLVAAQILNSRTDPARGAARRWEGG
jgi:hypothetical protein